MNEWLRPQLLLANDLRRALLGPKMARNGYRKRRFCGDFGPRWLEDASFGPKVRPRGDLQRAQLGQHGLQVRVRLPEPEDLVQGLDPSAEVPWPESSANYRYMTACRRRNV